MIKFFRHIRKQLLGEGKTTKYFKYAIGEILLVVIGILIALSINNWNENRKEQKQQTKLITQLLEDANIDSVFYESRLLLFSKQLKTYDILESYYMKSDPKFSYDSIVFIDNEVPFMAAASQSNIMSNKNEYSKINDDNVKKSLRDYTISYSYISKAINIHTETVVSEMSNLTKKYNIDIQKEPVKLSDLSLLREEKNIRGIIQLCQNYTKNSIEQAERFLKDNQQLIKSCKAYLSN